VRRFDEKGLTLIELLIAIGIMGMIAAAGSAMLSSAINAHTQGDARSGLYQEGLLAMERMIGKVQRCTYLLIPNAHNTTRNILAVSGFTNDDNDNYYDDPLFPRIDEDRDGTPDDGGAGDDDEDGLNDEDPLDGIDNDGDGLVDEDSTNDATADGEPGITGMDDDGDDSVDEGNFKDDDEDGAIEEDPLNALVYQFDSSANILGEVSSGTTIVLSSAVSDFQVTSGISNCVLITLTLAGDDGEVVTFSEYAYPRNILQKTGKRVR